MAKHVLYDAYVTVDGVAFPEGQVKAVKGITFDREEHDVTGMNQDQRIKLPGVAVVPNPTLEFYHDFDAASVWATLFPLYQSKAIVNLVVRPTSDPKSPTNPEATVPVWVKKIPFVDGAYAEVHGASVEFSVGGTATIATA